MSEAIDLIPIAENLWSVEGQVGLMPGVKFPARATIVRLLSGDLMIHSPIAFSEATAEEIRRLGEVTTLLAPNLYHHLFLEKAQSQFPDAKTVCGPGLGAKCKALQIDATFDSVLPALGNDFEVVEIAGAPRIEEVVLLHKPSRTLIVADYFFNIQESKGWLTPLVLKMTGSHKKATQSKLWRKMTKDKEAMARSANEVLALDFQRVVMCHGEIVEDGRAFTKASLEWLS